MKKSYRDNKQLALDILRGKWMLHDAQQYAKAARNFVNRTDAAGPLSEDSVRVTLTAAASGNSFSLDEYDQGQPSAEKYVMILCLQGCLTKWDNCFGTATMEAADLLDAYRDDEKICAFVLDIDSPGGCSNAVEPLRAAIAKVRATGKPVIAHCDQCCSAAYWIASACDTILADNILSEFGSVGAYIQYVDARAANPQTGEKVIEIYAPESVDKNKAYRDALDGNVEAAQKELSALVQVFIADVKAGRPDLDAEREGVLSGAVFSGQDAIDAGLADAFADLESCVEIAYVRANNV